MGTLIYRAGKADEKKWEWDPADPEFEIAYEVETVTDWPWQVFLAQYASGSHKAFQALVYAYLKRDDDSVRLRSVRVKYSDIDYVRADDEVDEAPVDDEPDAKGKKKKAGESGEA